MRRIRKCAKVPHIKWHLYAGDKQDGIHAQQIDKCKLCAQNGIYVLRYENAQKLHAHNII